MFSRSSPMIDSIRFSASASLPRSTLTETGSPVSVTFPLNPPNSLWHVLHNVSGLPKRPRLVCSNRHYGRPHPLRQNPLLRSGLFGTERPQGAEPEASCYARWCYPPGG